MGLLDFLLHPGGKRGWGELPAPEQKAQSWTLDTQNVVYVQPLIHGPGATDMLAGAYGDAANSAVFACLQVLATALAEPPLRVYRLKAGDRTELDDTPLGDLLARPNPYLTMDDLLGYVSNCRKIDGNAYWRKLRAGNPETGNVVQLWPISPSRIEPITKQDSGDFITAYRYYIRPGKFEDISPENIVHFRLGIDDKDHRLGLSPLKRLAREVSSDGQATRYADRLLANLAINGLSLEFDKDTESISPEIADQLKHRIANAYGGDNVGAVSVLSPGAKLVQHGFSPEQMDLKVLHRVPEERIAAVLGVPAIVAGLGAGLDRSTYSNFSEAREAFTEMQLIPTWRAIAETITMSLVPDFTSERGVSVEFNIDDVRALQDDQDKKATRLATYVTAGILDVNEARAEIGHEPKAIEEQAPAPVQAFPQAASRPRILTLPGRGVFGIMDRAADRVLDTGYLIPPSHKAANDLPAAFDRLRDDREPDWTAEMQRYLNGLDRRVQRALRDGHDTAEGLVVESEAEILGDVLAPLQRALLSDVHALVLADLGVVFQLDDAATREFLRRAASNIVGITETTRAGVRAALIEGQANGEGIDQLAARLRELPAFGTARARVVARTEVGHAANTAALATYRASGVVVGVRVFDGDYDSACAAMNGRTYPLGQEPPSLQHPNCRRAFAPIVDSSELSASA